MKDVRKSLKSSIALLLRAEALCQADGFDRKVFESDVPPTTAAASHTFRYLS